MIYRLPSTQFILPLVTPLYVILFCHTSRLVDIDDHRCAAIAPLNFDLEDRYLSSHQQFAFNASQTSSFNFLDTSLILPLICALIHLI